MLLLLAEMLSAGVTTGLTVTPILFEVELFGEAQTELDVTTHITVSPLFNAEVLNVAAFVPAFTPFTFH
jgi:hypothetical protein